MDIAHLLFSGSALLVGTVPFAYILGRWRGLDIRRTGSGNVGATNLARSAGLHWGLLALVLDAAKGLIPVLAARRWFPEAPSLGILAGGLAVVGHCYSPLVGFRGGKGVATGLGLVVGAQPLLSLLLIAIWFVLLAALRNVGVASSLTAIAAATVGGRLMFFFVTKDPDAIRAGRELLLSTSLLLLVLPALVVWRHRRNLMDFVRRPAAGSDQP